MSTFSKSLHSQQKYWSNYIIKTSLQMHVTFWKNKQWDFKYRNLNHMKYRKQIPESKVINYTKKKESLIILERYHFNWPINKTLIQLILPYIQTWIRQAYLSNKYISKPNNVEKATVFLSQHRFVQPVPKIAKTKTQKQQSYDRNNFTLHL